MSELLLVPDRVFDGQVTRAGLAVGITDGRITYVGPADAAPEVSHTEFLPGRTLTPGLVDMHVHVTAWSVFGFRAAGVTTVRDLGNDVRGAEQALARVPAHLVPRIHWVGPLLDGPIANWPMLARAHATPDSIAGTIRELAADGRRAIKLYANLEGEYFQAAVTEARRHGIRVVAHVGSRQLRAAAAAGVDEVQHLAGALARDLDAEPGDEAVRAFLDIPIEHCPTLVVWEGMGLVGAPRAHRDQARSWVPAAIERAWAESRHATQPPEERAQRLADLVERMQLVHALHSAGRRVLVGSDAAFIGLAPGFSLHDELGLLVLSGMPALDAMIAATSGNAEALGVAGSVGSITVGAHADLVAFRGDPTETITDLGLIDAVWFGGDRVDPVELRAAADAEFVNEPDSPPDLLARQRFTPAAQH
jgi:imidazolonepropionase-like amidohydrolase